MEAKEVQTKAWSTTTARTRIRNLLPVGNSIFNKPAHVGHHTVPDFVLLRIWLHGCNEPTADCKWQAVQFVLETETVGSRTVAVAVLGLVHPEDRIETT